MDFEGKQTIDMKCSFCDAREEDVEMIIKAHNRDVYICDDCVDLCNDILSNRPKAGAPDARKGTQESTTT